MVVVTYGDGDDKIIMVVMVMIMRFMGLMKGIRGAG